jgi:hypothetical protein
VEKDSAGRFWLQGAVGTRKSYLTSIVINHLIENPIDERLAFFYCSWGSSADDQPKPWGCWGLIKAYESIYQKNINSRRRPTSPRTAETTLKLVLCSFRQLTIIELVSLVVIEEDENGNVPAIKTLIENGAYLEEGEQDGKLILYQAIEKGNEAIVGLLLESGADFEE